MQSVTNISCGNSGFDVKFSTDPGISVISEICETAPAEDEMPVKAASINPTVFGVDHPARVSRGEIGGRLPSLFGLRALMRSEEAEGRTRRHWVLAACVLLS